MYNTAQINVNGFITLNNSVMIASYLNLFTTNGSGSGVFYRQINWPHADLSTITTRILSAYSNYTFFNATNALVVTWYNVQLVNTTQLNTFQLILAMDMVDSFLLFYYVRLDSASEMTCSSYNPLNTSFASMTYSANCTQGGSLVQNVNNGSM
jgi:hypothetical protein